MCLIFITGSIIIYSKFEKWGAIMLAKLEGYNSVEYTRGGNDKFFVSVYVSTDKNVTFGREYLNVITSLKYWNDKLLPAFENHVPVHVGYDKKKGNKPFLYVKG